MTAPSAAKCQVSVDVASVSVTAAGGPGVLAVTTTRDCTWSAQSAAPWVVLSSTTGQGSGEVAYRVAANTDPSIRRATLTVNDVQVPIAQEGTPCRFTVTPATSTVGPDGGVVVIRVETASAACGWTATTSDGWIHPGPASQGGTGTVPLTVDANTGVARTGRAVIAGTTISIEQAASPALPPGPSPTPGPAPAPVPSPVPVPPLPGVCAFTVSPLQVSIAAAGGSGTVSVATTASCAWAAASDSPWLVLAGPLAGTGSATIAYTILPSLSLSPRTGTLTVAGQAVTVTQAAVPPPSPCTFTITPASASIGAAPATLSVNVTTQAGCAWSEVQVDPWLELGSVSSGTGSGTALVDVQRYKGTSERIGTMIIAGRTFTVTQSK
ncbi:MAG TPA: BACON domain-containing protein [Vicinamibacterales bacterium]|nr:BACON domain-containing protein [Vicinamibacterales bacterium]